MSRSVNFLLIAAISAVVFLGCKKEKYFRGANPGDEIVFGGTAGSASGFRSSKTKGGDGDSSVAGALAGTGLDASKMESCGSYDSDADETFFFDWEDFEGGEALGGSSSDNEIHKGSSVVKACNVLLGSAGSESLSGGESSISCGGGISEAYSEDSRNGSSSFGGSDAGNGLFGASDSDVQTKTDYSGHKENIGGKKYERINWKVGDKVKILANGVKPSKTECVYEVSHVTASGIRSSAGLRPFNEADGHGLMWDSGNADFYAFYPGNSPSKVFASNTVSNFDVTVNLPKEQNTFTKITSGNHTEIRPDMELAAMLAVSRGVSPTPSVQLDFLPLVTTFRIILSNSLGEDIIIKKVSLVSTVSSEPMSGNYKVSYTKVGGSTLSSHSGLEAVHLISGSAQEVSLDLVSVPGGEVFLPKKTGSIVSSMSLTLFAVPVNHGQVQLKLELVQGGKDETHTLDLRLKDSGSWLTFSPYKKYDIRVGAGKDWRIEFNAADKSFPYTGGTGKIDITSRKTYYSQSVSLPWKVEGYCTTGPDGAFTDPKPDWLTLSKIGGGSITELTSSDGLNVSVSAQTLTTTQDAHTIALRGKSEVGTQSAPIDLSRVPLDASPLFSIEDGTTASTYASKPMNTANCYVVTRPGWYKIPVVYGNAIKNGNDNTEAYNPSVSYPNNFLKPFIRHDGNAITKPWIKANSGINLNSGVAELLWQDQKDLVQSIQLQPDKKYIVFHIDKATIHEGNAVIVLKKSATGDIVWSWHIWVCGSNDLRLINVKNNKAKAPTSKPGQDNFDFLSENLGACYDGTLTIYPESNVWVKVSNGRKTEVIKITRMGYSSITSNYYNIPYYQWGRKDPMLPSDGIIDNKVWYGNTGVQSNILPTDTWYSDGTVSGANAEIAKTIKNPQTFNTSGYGMDGLYYNLWDTKCNETGNNKNITDARFEPVTKSVYDPCPPGFCLPPNGAFTGFTSTGNTSGNSSELNVSGSFNKGWNFRTVLMGEPDPAIDPTIFFPASGYRDYSYSGGLYDIGEDGRYWSSAPYKAGGGGYALLLYSGSVFPVSGYITSYGHVLRPVKE